MKDDNAADITLDIAKVKQHWEVQAKNRGLDAAGVTHRDIHQRLLEIHLTCKYLSKSDRVLDVGCGNGYATAVFAPLVSEVLGVDYSPAMIARARREHRQIANVTWQVQDAMKLDVPASHYDVAVSLRCLINLGSWKAQQKAVLNIRRALRRGGRLILSEGSRQGRAGLNKARQQCGLPAMPPVAFNVDLDEEKFWPFVKQHFKVERIHRWGIYDFISRVVQPLFVAPAEPQYDAKINEIGRRIAERLSGMDGLCRVFVAVLRKV